MESRSSWETAVAEPREIDYLLDLVNEVVPSARLTREDVVMSYSGVRPLPFGREDSPSSIPRGHWIDENARGPIPILTLIGGKLTTCRALGEEVADRVLARLRLPRLASSRERPIHDPGGDDNRQTSEVSKTSEVSTITSVVEIIRHEWVRTLSDLVERRLLLIFDPTLDQPKLRELATLLAEEGVIPRDRIDAEVAGTITRLQQFCGLKLDGS